MFQIADHGSEEGIRGDELRELVAAFWTMPNRNALSTVMQRLERNGLVYSERALDEGPSGRVHRYAFYWLTAKGVAFLRQTIEVYQALEVPDVVKAEISPRYRPPRPAFHPHAQH